MAYPLLTPRLEIAPLAERDAAAFVAYRQVEDVARWQTWDPSYSAADAADLIASQPGGELPEPGAWLQLAIRDRATARLLGDAAVHSLESPADTFEIGITLAPASQHRGIASEAVARVLDHLFTVGRAHRVTASCDARNEAVARLLARVGMRRESSQRDVEFFKGEWITLDGFAILESEHAPRG
jgi:RimJ/RimL family protein N-acetyltransferase